jgi:AraC-like DNA-binding protein
VADVAVQLGFSDHAHFSRLFKQHTGLTPTAFAQQAAR